MRIVQPNTLQRLYDYMIVYKDLQVFSEKDNNIQITITIQTDKHKPVQSEKSYAIVTRTKNRQSTIYQNNQNI